DLSQMGNNKSDLTIAEPQRDLFGNLSESQMKMTFSKTETTEKIQHLIKRFFSIENAEEKKSIRDEINELVLQHIEYNIELRENQLNRFISEVKNPDSLKKNDRKRYDGYITDLNKIQATKANLLKIQETDERPYFLWHLYFKDVFDQGGFDVMIGNPPYIQLQKMGKETDILQEAGFETFARTGDIYCLFYEKGIDLLKKNEGVLSYITSNSWMKTKYGEPLRKFFVEKSNPIKLLNFEDTQIFPSATVEVNILITKRQNYSNETEGVALLQDSVNKSIHSYYEDNKITLQHLNTSEWIILSVQDFVIKQKIETNTIEIGRLENSIFRGVTTGCNEAFIINEETKNTIISDDPKSESEIKPVLKGRNLSKYSISYDNLYIIYAPKGFEINKFKGINKFLLSHKKALDAKTGNNAWFEFQASPSNEIKNCFENEKIIWGELSDKPKFAYDKGDYYLTNTIFLLSGRNLKFILCILNSKAANFYFNLISTTSGMGTNRWLKYKIEKLPIPKPNIVDNKPFETLAEYLIYLNDPKQAPVLEKVSNEAVSQVFEDLVNMMVYELYFEEEMKAKEIDVLQFVTEKAFPDITQAEDPKAIIQKVYYELQQKDNPIRNRILVASSRSETIARINAATS